MENNKFREVESKKRFLKRYKKNKACIERLEEKLAFLNDRIEGLRSPNMSGMPRGGQPVEIADLISDKEILEKRIDNLKRKSNDLKLSVFEEIDTLEDSRYTEILEAFFIGCKTFGEIAEDIGYTERHVIRLYSEALKQLVTNDI